MSTAEANALGARVAAALGLNGRLVKRLVLVFDADEGVKAYAKFLPRSGAGVAIADAVASVPLGSIPVEVVPGDVTVDADECLVVLKPVGDK